MFEQEKVKSYSKKVAELDSEVQSIKRLQNFY